MSVTVPYISAETHRFDMLSRFRAFNGIGHDTGEELECEADIRDEGDEKLKRNDEDDPEEAHLNTFLAPGRYT
jgi:hypothetical protein